MDEPKICDKVQSLEEAVEALRGVDRVFLDCEGTQLGTVGGSLSLITLGMVPRDDKELKVYIIDVLSLTKNDLRPLFELLRRSDFTKIVWDGRMDWAELYHGYGLDLKGAMDLQIADVVSRKDRDDEDGQIDRLRGYISFNERRMNSNCYQLVHRLQGLDQAAKEHGIPIAKEHSNFGHTLWAKRPLHPTLISYAARDARLIFHLYRHFEEQGYLYSDLLSQSERYVTSHRAGRPRQSDSYRSHPLLPLGILRPCFGGKTCNCCGRSLDSTCFPKSAAKQRCWVCRAVDIHNNQVDQRNDRDDYDFDDDSDDHPFGGLGGYFYSGRGDYYYDDSD